MDNVTYLVRPAKNTLLRSFAGHVLPDPSTVYQALVERLTLKTAEEGHFATDPVTRFIVQQGGWWYRAEYRVTADEQGGSRVEWEIFNVAPNAHWLGPITGRNVIRAAPETFRALLSELDRLG